MGELGPFLGGAGVFGVLALVIGYLLKSNRDDRVQFGKEIDDAEARAEKAEKRAESLQDSLDAALQARREAQDLKAEQARVSASQVEEIGKLRTRIEELTGEVAQMREQVT